MVVATLSPRNWEEWQGAGGGFQGSLADCIELEEVRGDGVGVRP